MKYLKLFENFYDPTWVTTWEKYLPESFTIIQGDKKHTRYRTNNEMEHSDMIQIMYEPKDEEWGVADDLEFDLYFVMDGNMRINVDITFGDEMVSEFSVETPNTVKVIQYTSYGSKFDPSNTVFAFTEESLQDLINFLNKIDGRFKLTRDKFNFLDQNPDNYTPS